jgi:hypothetical protein
VSQWLIVARLWQSNVKQSVVIEIMKRTKKSKYKHVVINRKKYYFYKIHWIDITGDAGHATAEEFDKFEASTMTTLAYVYKKDRKFIRTFASYDDKDEVFSDRNIFPIGCILKMEKVNI